MQYKVKNLTSKTATGIQAKIKNWLESREHINFRDINVWQDNISNTYHCTIVYRENLYEL